MLSKSFGIADGFSSVKRIPTRLVLMRLVLHSFVPVYVNSDTSLFYCQIGVQRVLHFFWLLVSLLTPWTALVWDERPRVCYTLVLM